MVNPITGLSAGTYLVEIMDAYGCVAEDVVQGGLYNAGQTFLPDGTGVSYESEIEITGFEDGQILESADQIIRISAVMEHSYVGDLSVVLEAPNGSQVLLKQFPSGGGGTCDLGEPVASGPIDEWNASNITPGLGYEYSWNAEPMYGTMNEILQGGNLPYHTYVSTWGNTLSDYYLPAGSYTPIHSFDNFVGTELNGLWTIIVTDNLALDNGYIFEWSISLKAERPDSIFTIGESETPDIASNITDPECGLSNGSIDLTVTGDFNPYDYLWNTGETTEDLFDVPSGVYTIDITGTDNCTYDYSYNLSDNGTMNVTSNIVTDICPETLNGSIDITITGGNTPYNFSWSNGETTEDISNLEAGDYTVTILDNSDCSSIHTFTIEETPIAVITADITNEFCDDNEGIIDITVTGGVPGYTYLWSNSATTEDIDELTQGDYTVTVTDQNSCSFDNTFTVINNVSNCTPDCDLEITSFTLSDEICGNGEGEIDLTVFTSHSPMVIQWSNGETTEDLTSIVAGQYTVNIYDQEGCQVEETFTINNQTGDLSIANIATINETCGNQTGEVDITVAGGAMPYFYSWNTGATTEDINNLHAGLYVVTVTDANGCAVTDNATVINETGDLVLTWGNATNETCGNGEGTIDILINGGNTPYDYSWDNGETTEDLFNLHAGDYVCTITDDNGCEISTPIYTVVDESGDLQITDIDVDNEICGNGLGEIEILFSGGTEPFNFSWSNGETTQDIFNLSAGDYSGSIIDDNGCQVNTGTLTIVNEPGTLELLEIIVTDELCNNEQGEIDLTITGGNTPYEYIWSNGATTQDLTNLSAGNYSCNITDANGCFIDINTTIADNQGTLEVVSIIGTDENCGDAQGNIDLEINGGTAPISFNWNTGATTEDINNLTAGTYNCIVTDNDGCEQIAETTIQNITGNLSLDSYAITNEQCGDANGEINLEVSGDEPPILFLWSNGATIEDLTNLVAGTYSCVITDNVGCSINAGPYEINNYSAGFEIENGVVTDETCGDSNGAIDLTITGGVPSYSYNWSNGATTEDISGVDAGNYTCIITDDNSCEITFEAEIADLSGNFAISNAVVENESCENGQGFIDLTIADGTEPYQFAWSNGATTEDISNLSADIYDVTITDFYNCVLADFYTVINDNHGFAHTNSVLTNEYCNSANGAIDITIEGGTEPYSFAWSNGATTEDIDNLSAGIYTCNVEDAEGCSLTVQEEIINESNGLEMSLSNLENEYCYNTTGNINIDVSGGEAPYTFAWNNGATTEDLTDISEGTYNVEITDNSGCLVISDNYIVENEINENLGFNEIMLTDDNCGQGIGVIEFTTLDGGDYMYECNDIPSATGDPLFENLFAGEYTLSIIDFGCIVETDVELFNTTTFEITDIQTTNETCGEENGAIDITLDPPSGDYTFLWSNGATTEDLTDIAAGNYSCEITDGTGCQDVISATVDNETSYTVEINSTDEYCGNSNGTIMLDVQGGTGTITYNWNTGAGTSYLTGLSAGEYTCEISDDNCNDLISVTIENITGLMNIDPTLNQEQCSQQDGYIELTITGTPEGHTVLWSNGETTVNIYDLSAGTYTVTVTDNSNDCEFYDTYVIENIMEYTVIENVQNSSCSNCEDGSIELTINPAETYTYLWSNGETTKDIYNLLPGDYTVEINNENNCYFAETYTVEYGTQVFENTDLAILIYPNPVDDILFIEFDLIDKKDAVLSIYNILGEQIESVNISQYKGTVSINTQHYAVGVYMLEITTNNFSKVVKFIKK